MENLNDILFDLIYYLTKIDILIIHFTYLLCVHRTFCTCIYDNEDHLHSVGPSLGINFHDLKKRNTYLPKMDYEARLEFIFHSSLT